LKNLQLNVYLTCLFILLCLTSYNIICFSYYKCKFASKFGCPGSIKVCVNDGVKIYEVLKHHNHLVNDKDSNMIDFKNILKQRSENEIGSLNEMYEEEARL